MLVFGDVSDTMTSNFHEDIAASDRLLAKAPQQHPQPEVLNFYYRPGDEKNSREDKTSNGFRDGSIDLNPSVLESQHLPGNDVVLYLTGATGNGVAAVMEHAAGGHIRIS